LNYVTTNKHTNEQTKQLVNYAVKL